MLDLKSLIFFSLGPVLCVAVRRVGVRLLQRPSHFHIRQAGSLWEPRDGAARLETGLGQVRSCFSSSSSEKTRLVTSDRILILCFWAFPAFAAADGRNKTLTNVAKELKVVTSSSKKLPRPIGLWFRCRIGGLSDFGVGSSSPGKILPNQIFRKPFTNTPESIRCTLIVSFACCCRKTDTGVGSSPSWEAMMTVDLPQNAAVAFHWNLDSYIIPKCKYVLVRAASFTSCVDARPSVHWQFPLLHLLLVQWDQKPKRWFSFRLFSLLLFHITARSRSRYLFENLVTGELELTFQDDDDGDSFSDVNTPQNYPGTWILQFSFL